MKYEEQSTQEKHIKDNILLLKTIKDIEVMGGSCSWAIVQMIGYIINRPNCLYEKNNSHVRQKKCILWSIWTQKEKTLNHCAFEKKKKYGGGVLL